MLNKLKFNNLVISNKKGIQQSRIQTINKLVHKIRKLKTQLEKHPDNTKCKERIRKSTETMELLKKLKRVDIMKKVLLLDKPAPAVMTNGLATPEEVGVALLCMNKVMQGLIKRFKTELQLDAENAGWKETLMESSKRRQKIERTEEKRRKRLEMKQQKAMGRKRQEWLEENQEVKKENEEEDNTGEKEANVSTTGSWQVEELPNVTTEEKKIENKSNNQLKRERPVKENPKKITPANKKQKLNEEIKKETPQIREEEVEDSTEDTESEQEEEAQTIKESTHKTVDTPPAISEDEEEPEEEMVVDPFFITDTGENYLSTAVIKRNQNNENENTEETRDLHMIKLNNYDKKPTDFRDRRQQNRDWKQKDFNQNRPQNNNYNNNNNKWNKREEGREQQQNKWQQNRQTNNGRGDRFAQNNKWNDRRHSEQDFKPRNDKTNNVDEKLHPSWAAKQKLKPVIAGFQGKKITFGDDGDNGKQMQQPTFNKTQTPKSVKSEQDSLHPSWAAKQKLKPAITAFQGKKITFDNDE